jgi:hypothetical protein
MKKLFFVIAIATFSFASAQDKQTFWVKPLPLKPNLKTDSLAPLPYNRNIVHNPQSLIEQSKLLHSLPNGNKVYALPLDNMPCIVPDISHYSMPVVKPDINHFNMPNPAIPPKNKIQGMTPEKLKELREFLNKNKVRIN